MRVWTSRTATAASSSSAERGRRASLRAHGFMSAPASAAPRQRGENAAPRGAACRRRRDEAEEEEGIWQRPEKRRALEAAGGAQGPPRGRSQDTFGYRGVWPSNTVRGGALSGLRKGQDWFQRLTLTGIFGCRKFQTNTEEQKQLFTSDYSLVLLKQLMTVRKNTFELQSHNGNTITFHNHQVNNKNWLNANLFVFGAT